MILSTEDLNFKAAKGFIVLEGANGAGKSTVAKALKLRAENSGKNVLHTFEPGNTEVGKIIRQIVLGQNSEQTKLTYLTELFLFCADRNLHVEKLLKPALDNKQLIICDRYFYSTLAFQGYGRGLDLKETEHICELACAGLKPDVVILLDLPAEVGLQRTRKRQDSSTDCDRNSFERDSFEAEKLTFHNKLREGFLEIAKSSKEKFVVIDATQSEQQVCAQALEVIDKLIINL